MMRYLLPLCTACITALLFAAVFAGDEPSVIPAAEKHTKHAHAFEGPRDHHGIAANLLGAVALEQIPELAGKEVRVREVTIQPGGTVGVHEHTDRPGFALILSGNPIEKRSDSEQVIQHAPGTVAFEEDGVVHYWQNPGTEVVRALVVDLVPASK